MYPENLSSEMRQIIAVILRKSFVSSESSLLKLMYRVYYMLHKLYFMLHMRSRGHCMTLHPFRALHVINIQVINFRLRNHSLIRL